MSVLRTLLAMSLLSLLFGCGSRKSPFERGGAGWKFQGVPLAGVDNASFAPLDAHFGRDAKRVYFCTTERDAREFYAVKRAKALVLPGADPATFRLLRNRYARDAQQAFYEHEPFAVKDLGTFEVLEYNFARDRQTGYFARQPIEGSDGASFVGLDSRYAKDKASVFHGDIEYRPDTASRLAAIRVPGADAATFVALDDGYARDAGQVYHRGRVISRDVSGFEVMPYGYARNGTEVFYGGELLRGADSASFVPLVPPTATADAKDARWEYLQGRRVVR